MMWEAIVALLILFFFVTAQAWKSNPERKHIHTVAFFLSVISVFFYYGLMLKLWLPAVFYAICSSYIYQRSDPSPTELISKLLFVFLVLIGFIVLNTPPLLILSVPLLSLYTLIVFSEKANVISVTFSSISLIFVLYFLGVEFGAMTWLNPSFILPETVVPSQIYYSDYYGHLVSIVTLFGLFSIYGSIGASYDAFTGMPYLIGLVLVNFLSHTAILPLPADENFSYWLLFYLILAVLIRRIDLERNHHNDLQVFLGLILTGVEVGMSSIWGCVLTIVLTVLTFQLLTKVRVINSYILEMNLLKSFLYLIIILNVNLMNKGYVLPYVLILFTFTSLVGQLNNYFTQKNKEEHLC